MLGEAKLIAFVATSKAEASRRFYEETLGLTLLEDSPFALVFDAGGTMLRVQKVADLTPHAFTSLGWEVGDIRATVASLQGAGVALERFDGMPQDEMGVWTTPDGAAIAWFKDPDGNLLSLTEWPAGAG